MYYLHHHQHTPSILMCIMRDGHAAVILCMTKTMRLMDTHCLFVTMELKSMAVRFFAHYSYLGLDPRNLEDQYANYWENNRNHALIQYEYAIDNPYDYAGYGEDLWGFTASYSVDGYAAHQPHPSDHGVITPTAALSSFPYTPDESMAVLKNLYYNYGDRVFGKYGFYDALSVEHDWYPERYLAIDQGPIVVMIENHRTGLLWDLFMSGEDVQEGLYQLGFRY